MKTINKTSRAENPPERQTIQFIQNGNERLLRLPESMMERAGLKDTVTVTFEDGQLLLASPEYKKPHPREGWEEQIKAAVAEHGNDLTEEDREWLDAPLNTDFDEKEWTW